MRSRLLMLATVIWVTTVAPSAYAGTGSPEIIAYSTRLPEARRQPEATLAKFNATLSDDQERMILFMLVVTLAEENRIAPEAFHLAVQRALIDVSDQVRGHAVHRVNEVFHGEDLQDVLRRCTFDKSLLVRYNAAEKMRYFPSSQSLAYLDALLGDESIEVRDCAATTLCQWHRMGDLPNIKDVIVRSLESKDIRRAGCAARILSTVFGMPARVDVLNTYLLEELKNARPSVASDNINCIIRTLADIRDPSSRPVLEVAKNHLHPSIKSAAVDALSKISTANK